MREVVVSVIVVLLMVGIVGVVLSTVGGVEYSSTVEVTVKDGDTLWNIASQINPNGRYNVNEIIYHIKEINQIDSTIHVGDVIEVPVLEGGE